MTDNYPQHFTPDFLERFDKRTRHYRRLQTLYGAMVADLGGPGAVTTAEDMLIRHVVFLDSVLSQWQTKYLDGAVSSGMLRQFTSNYTRHVDTLKRALTTLGLQRHTGK